MKQRRNQTLGEEGFAGKNGVGGHRKGKLLLPINCNREEIEEVCLWVCDASPTFWFLRKS